MVSVLNATESAGRREVRKTRSSLTEVLSADGVSELEVRETAQSDPHSRDVRVWEPGMRARSARLRHHPSHRVIMRVWESCECACVGVKYAWLHLSLTDAPHQAQFTSRLVQILG